MHLVFFSFQIVYADMKFAAVLKLILPYCNFMCKELLRQNWTTKNSFVAHTFLGIQEGTKNLKTVKESCWRKRLILSDMHRTKKSAEQKFLTAVIFSVSLIKY